jgi:hypothetical protein
MAEADEKIETLRRELEETRIALARCEERLRADLSPDWRCECGDLNRDHEAFCYRCGAGASE